MKMMNEKQIKERIYRLENEIRILKSILDTENDDSIGRPKGSINYTPEQIAFLEKHKEMKMTNLVDSFNAQFGTDYPTYSRALYNFMTRQGILDKEFI